MSQRGKKRGEVQFKRRIYCNSQYCDWTLHWKFLSPLDSQCQSENRREEFMLPEKVRLLLNWTSNDQGLGPDQLPGCLRKVCFSSLEVVSSIPRYPQSASLLQTSIGLLRSLQDWQEQQRQACKETAGGSMKVQPHFTCICQIICLSCTPFFVMWKFRCQNSALLYRSAGHISLLYPCFPWVTITPSFFFNDPCPAWSHFLTSPLACFPVSQRGADPRGTGRVWGGDGKSKCRRAGFGVS